MNQWREIAERVLFAESLEEELRPGPLAAFDDVAVLALVLPDVADTKP